MLFLAQETAESGSALISMLPLLLIGAFVYFAMIRPQRKRQQTFQKMQQSLSVGDDVITIGGIHGRVDAIGPDYVDLEVTDDVVMRFKRSAIADILKEEVAEAPIADADLDLDDPSTT